MSWTGEPALAGESLTQAVASQCAMHGHPNKAVLLDHSGRDTIPVVAALAQSKCVPSCSSPAAERVRTPRYCDLTARATNSDLEVVASDIEP